MTVEQIREVLMRLEYLAQPFFVCVSCVLLFLHVAPAFGLVDRPDARKDHDGLVPLVGGPAMLVAINLSLIILMPYQFTAVFAVLGLVLVCVGVFDDRYGLPAVFRLVVQALVALLMVRYAGLEIHGVGNLLGRGSVEMSGFIALVFTMVCTIGVINSVNMIDGVDGLLGSLLITSFVGLGWVSWTAGDAFGARMMLIFIGALTAFLCFNARVFVPRARVFMGDSGSTLMGFILVWFLIGLTQRENAPLSAVNAGWIFGLPLIDTVSVMVRRLWNRRSPFEAGRDHLHHRLRDRGLTVNQTVASMATLQAVLVAIGVFTNGYPTYEPLLFWLFVVIVVAYHFLVPTIGTTGRAFGAADGRGSS